MSSSSRCALGVSLLACSVLLVWGCKGDASADDEGGSEDGASETDTGDGDGDTTGDGDGDTTGDGDGDTGEECPPPDPPLVAGLEGAWAELPEPTTAFACSLDSGDGPNWTDGLAVSESEAAIDFVAVGSDGKGYGAGWINDGKLGTLVVGAEFGNNQNNERWARSWAYDADEWPARGMAATSNGRIWINTAPEHLIAVGEAGELLDSPIEVFEPGNRYISAVGRGDDMLLVATPVRETPPNCVSGTRVRLMDQTTTEHLATGPQIFTNEVLGLGGDGSGGAWMMILDLNRAGTTVEHYDGEGTKVGGFPATNADAYIFGGDLAVADNGDVILTLRGPFVVEVHRYDPEGNQLWAVDIPDLGGDYGVPHLAIDAGDEVVVGFVIDSGFGLARVLGDGTVDWAGKWTCNNQSVELRDVAVSPDGAEIWVGGVQDTVGWIGSVG